MENRKCEHHFILDQFGATCEKCGLYIDSDDIVTRCDYFDFYKEGFRKNLEFGIKWSHIAEMLYKEYKALLEKTDLVCWEEFGENSLAIASYENMPKGDK